MKSARRPAKLSHYEQAVYNPAAFYRVPNDVLQDTQLSKTEKLNILKQWEYDAREIMVAEEENMSARNDEANVFDLVIKAIHQLDPNYRAVQSPGTKQG